MPKTENDKRKRLNVLAGEVLRYIASNDPSWDARIQITKEERNFDDLQTIAAYVAYVLEQGAHLVVPNHPFFDTAFVSGYDPRPCDWCGKPFNPDYPGKSLCSNNCAKHFYAENPTSA
jgi:hypothetical protein